MEWKNLFRGMLIGVTDLIPGVSGGTVAFLLGIYDRLLESISGFFSRNWKKHIGFLLPLAVGICIALLLFSSLIAFLRENYFKETQFFFLGLIIGVIPFLMKQGNVKENFRKHHYVWMIIFAGLLASLAFVKPAEYTEPITTLTIAIAIGLFFAGWLASMAMLLPGISGSFVLLVLGVYDTAINALKTLNIPIIFVIGLGVIVGFILSSKGIRYMLHRYPIMTYAAIIGLIIGSVAVIFPGMPTSDNVIICIITFILGLMVSTSFSKIQP